MKEQPEKIFTCTTCGDIATNERNLCSPLDIEDSYCCEFCGNVITDPRHLCKPKMANLEYACGKCGRASIEKEFLCDPKPIAWEPKVDLHESGDSHFIEVDLPGVRKEDLKLELSNDTLEIKGSRKKPEGEGKNTLSERMEGSFKRFLLLPDGVESEKIEAKFSEGVLHIRIPKRKESKKKKVGIAIK